MGSIKISGIESLQLSTIDIPDSVLENILNSQAEIVAEEQRKNANTMLNEKGLSTGATAKSIKVKKAKRKGLNMEAEIVFEGKRPDGKRAGEVAFINEYGSRRNSARSFIKKAIDSKEDECEAVAEKIFREWQEKQ